MLAIIQSLSDETASLVRAFESLFRAYHRLILQNETSKGKKIRLPASFTAKDTLSTWACLPVLTASLPVLSAAQLKALPLPTIASFGRDFSVVATGITAPKKVACLSSRGEEYVQLLKRDEIRSDVVVQQLFLLLNDLLAEVNGNLFSKEEEEPEKETEETTQFEKLTEEEKLDSEKKWC